jgi:hypothetical protein
MDWIPVTDRLPPAGVNVLACSWLAKTYAFAYVAPRDGKWYPSFGSTRSMNITHWMPLPDLPQGKVYAVYQTDPLTRVKEQVGLVLERRKLDRGNNFEGIMKVAQKLYPAPSPETVISLE